VAAAEGQLVRCRGRLTIFEGRGKFQMTVAAMEPAGAGLLALAFEELKRKLAAEGLFAPERKRPLPFLPRRIGLVTSQSGAVLRDIIRVAHRRAAVPLLLSPTPVQGEGAARSIIAALRMVAGVPDVDVVIVARGGGSMEDLWCFNDEGLARAIAACRVPVISAVGHETDFTIADFVADLRAPTPSAGGGDRRAGGGRPSCGADGVAAAAGARGCWPTSATARWPSSGRGPGWVIPGAWSTSVGCCWTN
jgi:exodeoxyribonuclease VII large subunit